MKKCLWCKSDKTEASFNKKAHTIPKSLGGQNYNRFVCDQCNHFFGNATSETRYSIETALKETFCITRQRFLSGFTQKRQIGKFKSIFFDVKQRNGKYRLVIKQSFLFEAHFQKKLCRCFKRGLMKMWLEEFDRQSEANAGVSDKYDMIRQFARYNIGDLPVFYFVRCVSIFLCTRKEAETPILMFHRMKYLYEDDKFTEIEFLGQVFGFPITEVSTNELGVYVEKSLSIKERFFSCASIIEKLTDIDFTLSILDQ